jgi:hypothetical protein
MTTKTVTITSKLVCPYCKGRQEYKAGDYFPPYVADGFVSDNIQCDHCDEYFNAILQENKTKVTTFTNLLATL